MRFFLMLWAGVFLSLGGASTIDALRNSGEAKGEPEPKIVQPGKPATDMKETVLPEGAVRLGSVALKFQDGSYGVTFLGDGKRFAMLNDNRIRIFETAGAKEVRGWKAAEHTLLAIAATPDGKRIASAGNNDMIRLWDADTGKMIRQFNKHVGARVFSLTFSPDGKHLVSHGSEREPKPVSDTLYRSTDQGLRVWDVETGTELPAFKGGLVAGIGGKPPRGKVDAFFLQRINLCVEGWNVFAAPVVSETLEPEPLQHLRPLLRPAFLRVEGNDAPGEKVLRRIDARFGRGFVGGLGVGWAWKS